jgi:hypothetical protein
VRDAFYLAAVYARAVGQVEVTPYFGVICSELTGAKRSSAPPGASLANEAHHDTFFANLGEIASQNDPAWQAAESLLSRQASAALNSPEDSLA